MTAHAAKCGRCAGGLASRLKKRPGFLGVRPADYKDDGGALLEMVTNGGAAKRAGLKAGDVITKLNETTITCNRRCPVS